jgi:hypothetical protein
VQSMWVMNLEGSLVVYFKISQNFLEGLSKLTKIQVRYASLVHLKVCSHHTPSWHRVIAKFCRQLVFNGFGKLLPVRF